MVTERESSALAARLIDETQEKEDIHSEQLTIHMDRGGPMTSKSFALLLADLGITKSHSRPHVSDDNPFSESHFKTVKYMPDFPERFGSIQDARAYCRRFFQWYAMEHHHSGIALLTPHQVHHGRAEVVTQARQEVLNRVYAEHPERFVRQRPKAPQLPKQVWINPPPEKEGGNQETRTSVVKNNLPGSPRIDDLGSPRPVAPPEITPSSGAPATERGAEPVNGTSPEQDQQVAPNEGQPATKPVPHMTPLPAMAGGRLTKKTMSALH